MERDLICGMEVDPATAQPKAEHEGKTYYFCAPACRKAFEANPARLFEPGCEPSM